MSKTTLEEALYAFEIGKTPGEYVRIQSRIKRLSNEMYDLEDSIDVLEGSAEEKDLEKLTKKEKRLKKVKNEIKKLSEELGLS